MQVYSPNGSILISKHMTKNYFASAILTSLFICRVYTWLLPSAFRSCITSVCPARRILTVSACLLCMLSIAPIRFTTASGSRPGSYCETLGWYRHSPFQCVMESFVSVFFFFSYTGAVINYLRVNKVRTVYSMLLNGCNTAAACTVLLYVQSA